MSLPESPCTKYGSTRSFLVRIMVLVDSKRKRSMTK
jgi:hypothetical protein